MVIDSEEEEHSLVKGRWERPFTIWGSFRSGLILTMSALSIEGMSVKSLSL